MPYGLLATGTNRGGLALHLQQLEGEVLLVENLFQGKRVENALVATLVDPRTAVNFGEK